MLLNQFKKSKTSEDKGFICVVSEKLELGTERCNAQVIRYRIFCSDFFNLAVWQCGLATANNNVSQLHCKAVRSSKEYKAS